MLCTLDFLNTHFVLPCGYVHVLGIFNNSNLAIIGIKPLYPDSVVLEGVYNLELFVTQKCVENTVCTSLPAYNHTYFYNLIEKKKDVKAVRFRECL